MKILTYRGLDTDAIPGYDKPAGFVADDDFRFADVKKLGDDLYRARPDHGNRLLFAWSRSCKRSGPASATLKRRTRRPEADCPIEVEDRQRVQGARRFEEIPDITKPRQQRRIAR